MAVVAPGADLKDIMTFVSHMERLLPEPSAFSRAGLTDVRVATLQKALTDPMPWGYMVAKQAEMFMATAKPQKVVEMAVQVEQMFDIPGIYYSKCGNACLPLCCCFPGTLQVKPGCNKTCQYVRARYRLLFPV